MADRRIKVIIEAQDRASPKLKGLGSQLRLIGTIAAAVGAFALGRQLVRGFVSSVQEAAKMEKAAVGLAVALANQGRNTRAARKDLLDFARTLTDASLATETQIVSALQVATAMGASADAAKALTEAATELAASGVVDQDTAFRQLNRTLSGYAGELGELIPAVKELTTEQLQAGEAAAVVLKQFQGAGKAGAQTLQGALNNLNSAVTQLKVELGGPFAEVFREVINTAILPMTKSLTQAIRESDGYRNSVIDLSIAIVQLGRAAAILAELPLFKQLLQGFAFFVAQSIATVKGLSDALGELEGSGSEAVKRFDELIERLEALKAAGSDTADLGEDIGNFAGAAASIEEITTNVADLESGFDHVERVIAKTRLTLQDAINFAIDNGFPLLNEAIRQGVVEVESLETTINRTLRGFAIDAAVQFGDVLVEAAIEGDVQFKKFFKALLKDLAKAIAQALILRAILGAVGFGGGGGGGGCLVPGVAFAQGGIVPTAQSGLLVSGGVRGRDSVPIIAQPGESVLPRQLTEMLMRAAERGGGGDTFNVTVNAMDAQSFKRFAEDNPEAFAAGNRSARRRRF